MALLRRPFSRKSEFVALKTFRFDAATLLQPGDPVPQGTRMFHLMSLFRRRLIGAKDDPWALAQIPVRTLPVLDEPEFDTEVEPEAEDEKSDADGETEDE